MSGENNFDKQPVKEGGLDSIEQRLYSNDKIEEEKTELSKPSNFAPEDWQQFDLPRVRPVQTETPYNYHKSTFLNWLLGGSIVFFLVSLVIASYIFFGGRNIISGKNVVFQIDAPISISGGESFAVQITIENKNETTLLDNDFLIEYSEGVRDPKDLSKDVKRYRETLDDLAPGEKITKKIDLVLFGESSEIKNLSFSLQYRVSGSNATFSKKEVKSVSISNSPVSVSISSPSEVGSGSEVSFIADIRANASVDTKDLAMVVDYPFGFSLTGVEPQTSVGNNVWNLGDLKPGSSRQVVIKGEFDGGTGEERIIRFLVGTKDPKDSKKIAIPFLSKTQSILVTAPSVDLNLTFGGLDLNEYVAKPGDSVSGNISINNNLQGRLANISVTAKLTGNLFNKNNLDSGSGFFKSTDNEIIWSQRSDPKLAFLDPGSSAVLNFGFSIPQNVQSIKNPSMEVMVSISGEYSNDTTGIGKVKVSTVKKIKLASDMDLKVRTVYSTGPFSNTGPVPPKKDQETTYTVILSVGAGSNGITNGRVTTSLPIYTEWLDEVEPSDSPVMFNPLGGGLVWEFGDISPNYRKEIAFQIAFKPSANQVGSQPDLIKGVYATGKDPFSGLELSVSDSNPQSIILLDDPMYSGRGGPVQN